MALYMHVHPAIAAASLLLGVLAVAGLWWQAHLQPATAADALTRWA